MGLLRKIKHTYKNDKVIFFILLIITLFISFGLYEIFHVFSIIFSS